MTTPQISLTQIDNGQDNHAQPVMDNLNAIALWINTYLVHLDGAKAMQGQMSGPASTTPVNANDYTPKTYVDNQWATEAAARLAADKAHVRCGWGIRRVAFFTATGGSTLDVISFDTEDFDTNAFFAPTSTNVTVPAGKGGVYLVTAQFPQTNSFSGLGRETYYTMVYVNGAQYCNIDVQKNFGVAKNWNTYCALVLLTAGDVVTFRVGVSTIGGTSGATSAVTGIIFTGERLTA